MSADGRLIIREEEDGDKVEEEDGTKGRVPCPRPQEQLLRQLGLGLCWPDTHVFTGAPGFFTQCPGIEEA